MSFKDIVRDGLSAWGLPAPDDALARLEAFCSLVLETNKVMNLTAVTEPDAFAVRHVLDSLSILTCADLHGKKSSISARAPVSPVCRSSCTTLHSTLPLSTVPKNVLILL